MKIHQLHRPSLIKFTKNLEKILGICDTGIPLPEDCPPIGMTSPEPDDKKIFVYPTLLDYFDVMSSDNLPFSFFVGNELTLWRIRGFEQVLEFFDNEDNRLELRMKPNIEDILRRKKLEHIKRRIIAKGNNITKRAVTKKIHK